MNYHTNNPNFYGLGYNVGWDENEYGVNYADGNNYNYGRCNYGQPGRYVTPKPPPDPRYRWWGEGYSPKGPHNPREKVKPAEVFLLRCGVPRHEVAQLPEELLSYFGYDCCGLCGVEFTSMEMCRAHYLCKNHLKLQKKWLSRHKPKSRSRSRSRGNETRLRSRATYCELCDVEHTSNSAAKSHYSGKQHRAVVYGRKQTRNPSLLQDDKQERLEHLLIREKGVIDCKEVVQGKPIPSELWCNICETYMTCPDQMTIHLNGKRHLNKEKNYILRFMKGENPEEKSNTFLHFACLYV
ncbi:unnamed protein product [Chrysodeixis includens]|uniref:C2H2-type domain-containing protein n=1 Tax=Chrysodeixis includens TaxID=689277 RepID=A0A9P0BWR9_CHRIL|nr:unnamed protein product [Chrysodeixis includens]